MRGWHIKGNWHSRMPSGPPSFLGCGARGGIAAGSTDRRPACSSREPDHESARADAPGCPVARSTNRSHIRPRRSWSGGRSLPCLYIGPAEHCFLGPCSGPAGDNFPGRCIEQAENTVRAPGSWPVRCSYTGPGVARAARPVAGPTPPTLVRPPSPRHKMPTPIGTSFSFPLLPPDKGSFSRLVSRRS